MRAATWIEMVARSAMSGEVWSIIIGVFLLACMEKMDVLRILLKKSLEMCCTMKMTLKEMCT